MPTQDSRLEIRQFSCRTDNYGVLIRDRASGAVAAMDTPDESAVRDELTRAAWKLTHIFTTHSHFDHVAGHASLKRETGCTIYGPAKEASAIPGLDVAVKDGDRLPFGAFELAVIEAPGHTHGHVVFHIDDIGEKSLSGQPIGVVFAGDVLFSVGCGRVADNAYADMWRSTQKVGALPIETLLYCGHEYTKSNVAFALSLEPGNAALQARKVEVDAARASNKPTLPVSIGKERETNPFLRLQSPAIRTALGLNETTPDVAVFEAMRRAKDTF